MSITKEQAATWFETIWAKRKIDSLLGKEKKGKNEQHRPENHPGKTQDVAE